MKHRRPRVGIALDSGGAKGAAHIGVMDVLLENGIPIDIIAGSSAGAFAGALYATGTADKFKAIIDTLTWRESLSYYVDPVFPLSGLLAGRRARSFIHELVGDVQIEDLALKFTAVATDLLSGETVPIDSGPLVDAIMASVAMPGIFKPVVHMDRLLTDGGVTDPLPLDILKRSAPDITIAVNLHPRMPNRYDLGQKKAIIRDQKNQLDQDEDLSAWIIDRVVKVIRSQKILDMDKLGVLLEKSFIAKPKPLTMNIFEILVASTNIQQYQKNRLMLAHENPDILIEPDVSTISSLEFIRAKEAIAEGRRTAMAALPQIKTLLHSSLK